MDFLFYELRRLSIESKGSSISIYERISIYQQQTIGRNKVTIMYQTLTISFTLIKHESFTIRFKIKSLVKYFKTSLNLKIITSENTPTRDENHSRHKIGEMCLRTMKMSY